MALIEETGIAISNSFYDLGSSIILALPGVVAAVLILVLGYLVGGFIAYLVKKLLRRLKLVELVVDKANLKKEIGKWDLIGFLGLITKWYVFIVFLNPAAEVINFEGFSSFLRSVALWVPNVILAVIIAMAGYVLAEYISKKINETNAKKRSLLASGAKIIALMFAIMIALRQIGIDLLIAESSFLIVLAGVMLGLALAFGLGFRDEASKMMKDWRKKF